MNIWDNLRTMQECGFAVPSLVLENPHGCVLVLVASPEQRFVGCLGFWSLILQLHGLYQNWGWKNILQASNIFLNCLAHSFLFTFSMPKILLLLTGLVIALCRMKVFSFLCIYSVQPFPRKVKRTEKFMVLAERAHPSNVAGGLGHVFCCPDMEVSGLMACI